jgi:serine/threonine-protein kinase
LAPGVSEGVPEAGDVVAGKYTIERVLGSGGMGVVVAARHMQLGQRVAIKFMRGEAAHDANAVERFLREARASVALTSEHVAKVLDVGTLDGGSPYMVIEYLAGVDLAQVIQRDGPLPVEEAVGYLVQACEAVAEAHVLGIVHRDLKPANLFATRRMDGTTLIKVLDFGISKAAAVTGDLGASLTMSGMVMGSPGYMSPEQVRSAKGVDARSDIWSLGVILYELLAGRCPFIGETLGDTLAKIVSEAPPLVSSRRPELPQGLVAIVHGCLERNLGARIQNVDDLVSKLLPFAPKDASVSADRIRRMTRISTGGGHTRTPGSVVKERVETQASTDRPWHRSETGTEGSSRRWLRLAVGAVLLVGCGVSLVAWFTLRVPPPLAPAAAPATVAPPTAATPPFAAAAAPTLPAATIAELPAEPEPKKAAPAAAPPEAAATTERTPPSSEPAKPTKASRPARHPSNPGTTGAPAASGSNRPSTGEADYEHF